MVLWTRLFDVNNDQRLRSSPPADGLHHAFWLEASQCRPHSSSSFQNSQTLSKWSLNISSLFWPVTSSLRWEWITSNKTIPLGDLSSKNHYLGKNGSVNGRSNIFPRSLKIPEEAITEQKMIPGLKLTKSSIADDKPRRESSRWSTVWTKGKEDCRGMLRVVRNTCGGSPAVSA